jgi:hypothetical protein
MPHVKEVKWGEDNPIENAPVLTEEEEHEIKRRMALLDKILATEQKGKYKIEIMFGKARSMSRPTPGAMYFWESGSKLHGGGDAKIYMCPGKKFGINCDAFIPDASTGYGHLVCPSCKKVWQDNQVDGEILAVLTMKNWAQAILKQFIRLELNCDIYLKFAKDDIRSKAFMEQQRKMGGEKLAEARDARARAIYPLKNIIKDTSHGASLLGRFQAFLLA